jgi:hypothetical protein
VRLLFRLRQHAIGVLADGADKLRSDRPERGPIGPQDMIRVIITFDSDQEGCCERENRGPGMPFNVYLDI